MAALAIGPIIAAASPLLIPLIQSLVMHAENLFGAKTGGTKLETVVNAVLPIAQQLAASGKLPGQLDAGSITAMVESVVQNFKAQNILNPDTAKTVATQSIATATAGPGGQSFKISGGTLQLSFG